MALEIHLDHDGALSVRRVALRFFAERRGVALGPSSDDGQESADAERRRKGDRQGEDLHRVENARQSGGFWQRARGQRQQPRGGASPERQQRGPEQRDLEGLSSLAVHADPPGENKPQGERG